MFEWDSQKALSNEKKHNINFNEAKTVFFDENAKVIHDPAHSTNEDRFIILGLSADTRILVVCHCYRKNDRVIRIISARKASKRESNQYGSNYHG
ncbi:MAG: BrnT family toxin [Legionella sp.]|nr:BrnT family toxin [Legionella sp.]